MYRRFIIVVPWTRQQWLLLVVKTPGTPASSSHGAVAIRVGDATPYSALQDRLRSAPLMSKVGATYK